MEHEHNETIHTHTTESVKKSALTTPGAIVVAGFLIAVAIVGTKFAGTSDTRNANGVRPVSARIGLNQNKFNACLTSGKYKARVESEYQEGVKAGINGTPWSIIVGKNGAFEIIEGAYPTASVQQKIDKVLATTTPGTTPLPVPTLRDGDYILGNKDADVIIYEYSDTECPFCKRFHATMHELINNNKGKVAFVYRQFPLDSIHPKTRKESEALLCAGELGGNDAFWKYLDTIFEITPSNNGLDPDLL